LTAELYIGSIVVRMSNIALRTYTPYYGRNTRFVGGLF